MDSQKTTLDNLVDAFIKKREKAPLLGKIGLVRSLIGEIDAAKNDGFGFGVILEALMKNGFKETNINQFYGLVNRTRLEGGSGGKEVITAPPKNSVNLSGGIKPQIDLNKKSDSTPPTLAEMKESSQVFDIDPTQFD